MGTSPTRIGLIHATMNSVQPIHEAFRAQAPHVILLDFMDEGLIFELNETGVITTAMIRRLVALIARAEESGVDGILLTCSSFSPYVPQIRSLFYTGSECRHEYVGVRGEYRSVYRGNRDGRNSRAHHDPAATRDRYRAGQDCRSSDGGNHRSVCRSAKWREGPA